MLFALHSTFLFYSLVLYSNYFIQFQKVVPNIKQQLPLKLATKLGGGSSPSPPTSLTSPTSSVVQMLPLKLSSSVSGADSMERRRAGGYTRLNSPGGSSGGTEQHSVPSHARTGSSPAMMQTIEVGRIKYM